MRFVIYTLLTLAPLVAAGATEYRDLFDSALHATYLPFTKAAAWMEIDASQLRRQLNAGTFPTWREMRLPPNTWDHLAASISALRGGRLITGQNFDLICRLFNLDLHPQPAKVLAGGDAREA